MARMTQIFDYLKRNPKELTAEFVLGHYSHIELTPDLKALRHNLKEYKTETNHNETEGHN